MDEHRLADAIRRAVSGRVYALDTLSTHRALPKAITVDHGTEFTSKALDEWTYRRGVQLDFIRTGTSTASCRSRMPRSSSKPGGAITMTGIRMLHLVT